jgi:hypothetical protein
MMSFVSEHDDRVSDSMRRVSFKAASSRIGKPKSQGLDMAIRACIADDDVDMSTPGSSGRSSGRL